MVVPDDCSCMLIYKRNKIILLAARFSCENVAGSTFVKLFCRHARKHTVFCVHAHVAESKREVKAGRGYWTFRLHSTFDGWELLRFEQELRSHKRRWIMMTPPQHANKT